MLKLRYRQLSLYLSFLLIFLAGILGCLGVDGVDEPGIGEIESSSSSLEVGNSSLMSSSLSSSMLGVSSIEAQSSSSNIITSSISISSSITSGDSVSSSLVSSSSPDTVVTTSSSSDAMSSSLSSSDTIVTISSSSEVMSSALSSSSIQNDNAMGSYVVYYDSLIVFRFDKEYEIGQFANGDYWVHNNGEPVVITAIEPEAFTENDRTSNGAMVNPEVGGEQGYESQTLHSVYVDSLNRDPGHTGESLIAYPGNSIIKAISLPENTGKVIVSDAAVLTVLAEKPPEGAFRPPYCGAEKGIPGTIADLDYSVLGNHPKLGGEPDINEVAGYYEKVWIEHNTDWTQRDIHPFNHQPNYGRDITKQSGHGLVLLQLDYTQAEKELLLIRLVQYGIDIYGVVSTGATYYHDGGHSLGRKMPLLLASQVLKHETMAEYADASKHFIFQDDQQHFYVTQGMVDLSNSDAWAPDDRHGTAPYTVDDIEMAEWGIRAFGVPAQNNRSWDAIYRHTAGPAQMHHVLAAYLMGVQDIWNWPALFDYAERYNQTEPEALPEYMRALREEYWP